MNTQRRSIALLSVVVATLLILAGCAAPETPRVPVSPKVPTGALTSTDVTAWLDGMLPAVLEREGIVGATVSVVADGEVLAERGYGYADVAGDPARSVDPQSTLFRIGSISKVFTATIVMQLVQEGLLDLDAPVQDLLDFRLQTRFDEPVTLRHLLTHTAGFEDELAGVISGPDSAAVSLREAVSVDSPEQIFRPGTTPAYSNYSNGLAAYVAERAAGVPFAQLVQHRIFDPAEMSTATMEQPLPDARQANMSKGYQFAGSTEVPFEVVGPAPAGAISATASDMSRFMLAQLGSPAASLLDPNALAEMHEPALESDDLGGLTSGPVMTLGFFERNRNGHRILSHGGDLTAFHAQLELYPDDDAGIFISLNSTGIHPDSTTVIRNALTTQFADRYFPDDRPVPVPADTAAAHAAAIAGSYQFSRRGESTFIRAYYIFSGVDVVAAPDGTMTVSAIVDPTGRPVPFVETDPWVWTEVGGQRVIAVDQTDGKVNAIGFDPAFTLQPMPAERAALPFAAVFSMLALLVVLVAHPVVALVRRKRIRRTDTLPAWRRAGWLVWAGALSFVLSILPWSAVANALLTDGPTPGPLVIRLGQLLLVLAALGVVPALWRVVLSLRPTHRSWARVTLATLVAAAFAGLVFVLLTGGVLQLSLSY